MKEETCCDLPAGKKHKVCWFRPRTFWEKVRDFFITPKI